MEDYAGVDEALDGVKASVRVPRATVTVDTAISFGRVSAEDVKAPSDLPPFSTSHMDGFAVRAVDLRGATTENPIRLKTTGQSPLGGAVQKSLRRGEAVRVATGSRIPVGADTVIRSEMVKESGGGILVESELGRGTCVYRRGDDVRRGDLILARGRAVRAQDIGVLLALGVLKVKVSEVLKVAVLATGSELTDATDFTVGRVRDSHSPMFLQLLKAQGCQPVNMGIVRDEREAVVSRLRKALTKSDLVLTLGGTSVGRHDVVGDAVSALGPEVIYHGIRMDRGRVTGVAAVRGKAVLMMPGPIQGAMSAFILFGLPLIRYLGNRTEPEVRIVGTLEKGWKARRGFADFRKVVYVRLKAEEKSLAVEPLAGETESMKVLNEAYGYLVVDETVASLDPGSQVEVRLLPGFSLM